MKNCEIITRDMTTRYYVIAAAAAATAAAIWLIRKGSNRLGEELALTAR